MMISGRCRNTRAMDRAPITARLRARADRREQGHGSPRPRARQSAFVALVAAVATVGMAGVGLAAVVLPANSGGLKAVGPTSSEVGFPVWYKDVNNTTLELCTDGQDPNCGLVAEATFDPTKPAVLKEGAPVNFPEEAFWWMGTNVLTTSAGKGTSVFALEAAFNGAGEPAVNEQISFGRIRFRVDVPAAGTYTITHPYGTDEFEVGAADTRAINYTEDVGIGGPGDFTGALNARIGPFLSWDADAPAGYVGDPAVDHTVTGSPRDTNFVRITGPGTGIGVGSPDRCTVLPAGITTLDDCVERNLFSVQGKLATNFGEQGDRAVYSRTAEQAANGGGRIQVFAHSEADQALQLARDSAAGIASTPLAGDGKGGYFALATFNGPKPANVVVRNAADIPVSSATLPLVDEVIIDKADYDADAKTLTVAARSGDESLTPADLTVTGLGPLTAPETVFDNVAIPPLNVEVTSTGKGSASRPATVTGAAFAAVPIQAAPVVPATVPLGATVTLDGSASLGDIDTYLWTPTGASPAPADPDAATTTVQAPTTPGTLTYDLTVTGPNGTDTKSVSIQVVVQPLVATAVATPATAAAGQTVTLDGTDSTGAVSYRWAQVVDPTVPTVTLTGADTAQATFPMPVTSTPLQFTLTVTSSAGTTATSAPVSVGPIADTLAFTQAEVRTSKGELRISGTATAPLPDSIDLYLDRQPTPFATAVPVVAGNPPTFDLRLRSGFTVSNGNHTVTAKSTRGGEATGTLTVRR